MIKKNIYNSHNLCVYSMNTPLTDIVTNLNLRTPSQRCLAAFMCVRVKRQLPKSSLCQCVHGGVCRWCVDKAEAELCSTNYRLPLIYFLSGLLHLHLFCLGIFCLKKKSFCTFFFFFFFFFFFHGMLVSINLVGSVLACHPPVT